MKLVPKWIRQLIAVQIIEEIAELDADDLETFKALVTAKVMQIFRL